MSIKRAFLPFVVALAMSSPVLAQNQLSNSQPVKGAFHEHADKVQAKLKDAFKAGKIDSTELASMQRDFDGLLVQENDLKSRPGGMTDSSREHLDKELGEFEGRLDKRIAKAK